MWKMMMMIIKMINSNYYINIIVNSLNNMVVFCFLGIGLWLKHHRLHKYTSLFSNLTYEDMLNLTSEILETKVL